MPANQGEGATPAPITEHAFVPDGAWWESCRDCGLSEAAHLTTALCHACGGSGGSPSNGNCDRCQGTGIDPDHPESPL